jgi:hypothetical protein
LRTTSVLIRNKWLMQNSPMLFRRTELQARCCTRGYSLREPDLWCGNSCHNNTIACSCRKSIATDIVNSALTSLKSKRQWSPV